jgi:hypothetical protein
MWELRRLTTLWAFTAGYVIPLPYLCKRNIFAFAFTFLFYWGRLRKQGEKDRWADI